MKTNTAKANSNIAFIKYWGNQDNELRIPANSSISMNLKGIHTETKVTYYSHNNTNNTNKDTLEIDAQKANPQQLERVQKYLTSIKQRYNINGHFNISSHNNFPMGAGIASSASAFAALATATMTAIGIKATEKELSTLARLGSGSASRSIPDGFVIWHKGRDHESSFAETIAPSSHWDLVDVIAITSQKHKNIGSSEGHQLAWTSDLQAARVERAEERVEKCKNAILEKDFKSFAEVVEEDSNLMHAVMMTSRPSIFYWSPTSLEIMEVVRKWRQDGLNVFYTLDAGPNVHCICTSADSEEVAARLANLTGITEIRVAKTGEGAQVISEKHS